MTVAHTVHTTRGGRGGKNKSHGSVALFGFAGSAASRVATFSSQKEEMGSCITDMRNPKSHIRDAAR